ncbi:MAG: hypothetical protein FJ098_04905, partial [Deltaproteobacteria bacterium]|nr:hypothetical protein [Deltaproteobacteria bacterium]
VAVDGGIPALILFAGLLLLSAWVWFRGAIGDADPGRRAEAWAQVALVVGLAVFGVVSSVPYAKLTWLVFAYAAVELRVRQMEEKAARFQAGNQAFEEAAAGASPPSDTVVIIRKD